MHRPTHTRFGSYRDALDALELDKAQLNVLALEHVVVQLYCLRRLDVAHVREPEVRAVGKQLEHFRCRFWWRDKNGNKKNTVR